MKYFVRVNLADKGFEHHVVDQFGNVVGRYSTSRAAWSRRNALMGVRTRRAIGW